MLVGPPVVAVVCRLVHLGLLLNGGVLAALSSAALQRRETSSAHVWMSKQTEQTRARTDRNTDESPINHFTCNVNEEIHETNINATLLFFAAISLKYTNHVAVGSWSEQLFECTEIPKTRSRGSLMLLLAFIHDHHVMLQGDGELPPYEDLNTLLEAKDTPDPAHIHVWEALDWCYRPCSILICPSCEVDGLSWQRKVLTNRFRQICQ